MSNTKKKSFFYLICLVFAVPAVLLAERVKPLNPDCAVCPVVISYEGEEAKKLLGSDGTALLMRLANIDHNKTIKIDMDGIKSPGSESDSDNGYELLVFVYPHLIAINCIQDESSIKISTDHKQLNAKALDNWSPEIHLKAAEIKIEKDDDLEIAWEKIKISRLYKYISNMGKASWDENLSDTIHMVLKAAVEK